MSGAGRIIKRRVRPYPFPVQFSLNSKVAEGQVMKLVLTGLMVHLSSQMVIVGETWTVNFDLPGGLGHFAGQAKVIKTYDRIHPSRPVGSKMDRFAEFHFVGLKEIDRKRFYNFLTAIRQIA